MTWPTRKCDTPTGSSLLACVGPETVHPFPFPHVVIDPALPEEQYRALAESRPSKEWVQQGRPLPGNARVDRNSISAMTDHELPEVWREFIWHHTSQAFWHELIRVFGPCIRRMYPHLEMRYGPLAEWTCAPRGVPAKLQMECQIGINTPTTTTSRVRGPHLDNPLELFAGMLYMAEPGDQAGGDLQICKLITQPHYYGKLEIKDECVMPLKSVPYKPNIAVFFINGPHSIHSVTTREASPHTRNLVNFIGEVQEPLFKVGHGRY